MKWLIGTSAAAAWRMHQIPLIGLEDEKAHKREEFTIYLDFMGT